VDPRYNRAKLMKRVALGALAVVVLLVVFAWGPAVLSPSVSRNRIRTAVVAAGPIESTLTASGAVVPEFEQVLAAPVSARVLRILKKPGDSVRKGDPIVELDTTESESEVKTTDDQLAMKENEQGQLRINLETALIELKSQLEIKKLEAEQFEVQVEQNRKLRAENLISDEDYKSEAVQRA
jgi:HlyD family secretion protein